MKQIVLRHAHEVGMSGFTMEIEHDVKTVTVPMVCGCLAFFSSMGHMEQGDPDREVWNQTGMEFKKYTSS